MIVRLALEPFAYLSNRFSSYPWPINLTDCLSSLRLGWFGATASSSTNYVKLPNSAQPARCLVLSDSLQPPSQPPWNLRLVCLSTRYLRRRQRSSDVSITPTTGSEMTASLEALSTTYGIHHLALPCYLEWRLGPLIARTLFCRIVATSPFVPPLWIFWCFMYLE